MVACMITCTCYNVHMHVSEYVHVQCMITDYYMVMIPLGFFRRNGGCGYILKPAVMRKMDPGGARGGSAPYSPFMEVAHPDVPTIDFEIEVHVHVQCACATVQYVASGHGLNAHGSH